MDADLSIFPARLKEARENKRLSQEQLANLVNVSRSAIQSYERGTTRPKTGVLRELVQVLECDFFWLLGLNKEAEKQSALSETMKALSAKFQPLADQWKEIGHNLGQYKCKMEENGWPIDGSEYIYIPVVSGKISRKNNKLEEDVSRDERIAFNRDWIFRIGRPVNLKMIEMKGSFMEPLIFDKDLVLFDISRTEIRGGKIYAVAFDEHIYLKRLIAEPGKLILRSENKQYSDITLERNEQGEIESIQILGQAIWWCHAEAV